MEIRQCIMDSISIIGKEGSTKTGPGFIRDLWEDANGHFHEIENLALRDEERYLIGVWGAMTDFSRTFKPWEEDLSKGLYLAGVQVDHDTMAPENWVKWTLPAFEYLYTEYENAKTIEQVLEYMKEHGIQLVGAIQELTCPKEKKSYRFFPIRIIQTPKEIVKI